MLFPVGITKGREEFYKYWYLAQKFGSPATHEGLDINRKTGGNTDFGEPVFAIAEGDVVYSHYNEHSYNGFGRHIVLKIVGPWGVRYPMYSHLDSKDFLAAPQHVFEGQQIGAIGRSGNSPLAHLHLSLHLNDPGTIPGGIDKYPRTVKELNTYWEDPLAFIEKWYTEPVQTEITDDTIIPQISGLRVREIRSRIVDLEGKIAQVRTIIE